MKSSDFYRLSSDLIILYFGCCACPACSAWHQAPRLGNTEYSVQSVLLAALALERLVSSSSWSFSPSRQGRKGPDSLAQERLGFQNRARMWHSRLAVTPWRLMGATWPRDWGGKRCGRRSMRSMLRGLLIGGVELADQTSRCRQDPAE